MTRQQDFANQEAENRVTEKLELLVIELSLRRLRFGGKRAMSESADQQLAIAKRILQSRFEGS